MIDFDHVHGVGRARGGSLAPIARPLAWACVVAIAVLSLVPGALRPHTILPGWAEHFVAYAGTGFFFALGYSDWRQRLFAWIGLAIASGVFEILQEVAPERSSSLFDAVASACGLTFGLISGAVASAVLS
ncbi:MAG: hypothetical protein HYZ60_07795, partial [Methylocystis sp.]|nr:hypothetical protein [Methylocystis sp.]